MSSDLQSAASRQVLFIAHEFPPVGGAGVQRSAKFVKYLAYFGWDPVVLTPKQLTQPWRDNGLAAEIPPKTEIVRVRTLEPRNDFRGMLRYLIWGPLTPLSIPDMGNWWMPCAVPVALQELGRRPIRAIYATGAPFSSHILAAILKTRTGLPLVLDYRDEWTLDPLRNTVLPFYRTRVFMPWERFLHRWAVNKADRVILVTENARRAFIDRFGCPDKFLTIRNGFDTDDFGIAVEPDLAYDQFHLAYVGSTTGLDSRPDTLLKGLRLAVDRTAGLQNTIRVHLVGDVDPQTRALIKDLDLSSCVLTPGYVPHNRSVGYLRRADVLLMFVRHFPNIVPGKLYEYLGARKPVLVLGRRDGESLELLNRAGLAIWVDPESPPEIGRALTELDDLWRQRALARQPDEDFIENHTRKRLTQRLAQVLDEVTEDRVATSRPKR